MVGPVRVELTISRIMSTVFLPLNYSPSGLPVGTRTPTNSFGDCDAAITPLRDY